MADKPVVAKFDQQHASSDGGALLLQACDRRLGLTDALIGGIDDRRQSGKIRHAIGELVRQRLYAIACGYPDGNDAGRLGADPIQRLLCGRDPLKGEDLASQPTLSRFENSFDRADLHRMSVALADTVIERHRRRLKRKAKRITIDLVTNLDSYAGQKSYRTGITLHRIADRVSTQLGYRCGGESRRLDEKRREHFSGCEISDD